MAFLDNNPTFTYVKVSNLSILYEDRMYAIQDIYTNCKYLYKIFIKLKNLIR